MNKTPDTSNNLYFLSGGGEMGELTRAKDWSKTPLGDPKDWPQSLKTTVAIMLDNPFGMYIAWGSDYIQLYNDGYRPILGATKHPQALGITTRKTFEEIWHIIGPMFNGVMSGKAVGFPDFMLPLNRNGFVEECYFDFSYSPIRMENGEVGGVLVTVIETTNKKKAEDALKESEARFRTMAESSSIKIALSDETSKATYFNKAWTEFTGRSMTELLDFGWADLIHEEDREGFVNIYLQAFAKQESWIGEFRTLNKNREYRWLLAEGTPRFNADRSFAGYISSSIDITEHIVEKKRTREAEEKASLAIESANLGVYDITYATDQMSINKRFKEIWGFDDSATREQYAAAIHPDDLLPREIAHKASLISGHLEYQARVIWKDKSIHWVWITGTVIFDDKRNPIKLIGVAQDVTDTVTAQEKIRQSEQRVRSVVESSPFPIGVYIGKEMRIELANQNILDTWGKGNDVIGKRYSDILPELVDQKIFEQLDDVYETGIAFHAQNQRVDLVVEGKLQPYFFNYSFTPLFDSSGKVYGVVNTAANITDLAVAKLKIQKSEENLRNTILQAPVAMCILRGPNHICELANERMFELWGKPSEELLNKPIFEALHEAKNQGFEELLGGVFKTGQSFSAQAVPITLPRNGKPVNIFITFLYEAYREADGSISGVMAVAMDVTDQVMARKSIESGYNRFLALSEAMPQIVWTATPDGNLDYFSKQWWGYSGLTHEQSVGAGWASTIHMEDLPELTVKWADSLRSGKPYQVEARVRRADGTYRWLLIRALAIRENSKIIQWVGTCTDIEDQKKSERELQYMSAQLASVNEELAASNEELSERSFQLAAVNEELAASNEELSENSFQLAAVNEELISRNEELGNSNLQLKLINSDLDNFIYTASHDLKAPIANIEGLMINLKEHMLTETHQNEEVELVTSLIEASIERFKKTINQLTDITKLQTEYNQNATEVVLKDILDEIKLDLQIMITQSNAVLEIDDNSNQSIYFPHKNLRSIIYNLLSNAIKYRSPKRPPHIHVSFTTEKGYQVLSISDNGLGIDLSNESKLFAIFGRLHDHVEGSGIGLYIVKKMVENAGGKIEVESQVDVGSTFRIYFKNKIVNDA